MLFHHSISYIKKSIPILIFTAKDHHKPNKILNFNLLKTKKHYQKINLFIFY
ncbi:protein of unknown function [Chryseobacterium sp. JV274]|jgi:hypothetical protein|nr:protein of unknown function [Chryseobacterium sp. JV274]